MSCDMLFTILHSQKLPKNTKLFPHEFESLLFISLLTASNFKVLRQFGRWIKNIHRPYRCWNFSCFPDWFIFFRLPTLFSQPDQFMLHEKSSMKCFLLFFIGFKFPLSVFSWLNEASCYIVPANVYHHSNRKSINYQYITFGVVITMRRAGKEFIFDNDAKGWTEINYTKLKRQSNQQR